MMFASLKGDRLVDVPAIKKPGVWSRITNAPQIHRYRIRIHRSLQKAIRGREKPENKR
jgi:hypothetical protein